MITGDYLIDPLLVGGPPLGIRFTWPGEFAPFQRWAARVSAHKRIKVRSDASRDKMLGDYRRCFDKQVCHDLDYNLQRLWYWAVELDSPRAYPRDLASRVFGDAAIQDGFRRLELKRRLVSSNDMWTGNRAEIACWNAVQHFYCDALALARRLLIIELRGSGWRRPRRHLSARRNVDGNEAYSYAQALVNALEQPAPNFLNVRPLRGLLPALAYGARTTLWPWPAFRWQLYLRHARRCLRSGAVASLAGPQQDFLNVQGAREFLADDFFFDQRTRRTRHNVIVALSHRHVVLDAIIASEVLADLPHGVMADALYTPRSAARDAAMVLVRFGRGQSPQRMLRRCADVLVEQKLPLLIAVDGIGPHLMYGQQIRVKRGVRLVLDHVEHHARRPGRKTYIVPMTLDDVAFWLKGRERHVALTMHRPICADDIEPAPEHPDARQVNWGDPLLNYLECFYLAHTGQVRHGWRTPRVIETVRRVDHELRHDGSVRGRLRARLHPSIYDLGRDWPDPPVGTLQ